jgi:hypothetical protein
MILIEKVVTGIILVTVGFMLVMFLVGLFDEGGTL